MSMKEVITCDICGAEKNGSNDWTQAVRKGWREIVFRPWYDILAKRDHVLHLCGQECAHKALDRFLTEASSANTGSREGTEAGGV